MPRKAGETYRKYTRPKKLDHRPLDYSDLDELGLSRRHFYDSFKTVGGRQCPVCQERHLEIRRQQLRNLTGWEWRCTNCGQKWREPQIIPSIKSLDK